ncbi:hypothetical protein [Vibrio sp. TRT 17S01]|uniref:hypothetical protein n=1 Tax=Vibrio sp. TRT 17S01 TaxID=3418505 RepID=UPI003CEE78F4
MEEISDGTYLGGNLNLGNTEVGDGKCFKGRGNYRECQEYLNTHPDCENLDITSSTALAEQVASNIDIACLYSAYYWKYIRPKLNSTADRDDIFWVSVYVNGWRKQTNPVYADRDKEPNHMADRIKKLEVAKKVISI